MTGHLVSMNPHYVTTDVQANEWVCVCGVRGKSYSELFKHRDEVADPPVKHLTTFNFQTNEWGCSCSARGSSVDDWVAHKQWVDARLKGAHENPMIKEALHIIDLKEDYEYAGAVPLAEMVLAYFNEQEGK